MKKKILSLLTAFAMVFGILVAPFTSASADTTTDKETIGTIASSDISKTKPDSTVVVVHKLQADNFDSTKVPSKHNGGELKPTDYQALGTNVKPLAGVEFTYYKLKDEAQLKALEAGTLKIDAALKAGATKVAAKTTGEDGTITTDGLDEGYYWFEETKKPENVSSALAVPFGISLPLTNVTEIKDGENKTHDPGTVYLKKVHVYPKNTTGDLPKTDKDVNEIKQKTANFKEGDPVTWFIKGDIPANLAEYKTYYLTDTLDSKLTYVGKAKVLYGTYANKAALEAETKTIDGTTNKTGILPADYYTLEQPTANAKGGTLKLTLTEKGRKNLYSEAKPAHKLYFYFETKINETAIMGKDIENTVTLKFINTPNGDKEKEEHPAENPKVNTGGKKFVKVDKSNNDIKLQDAVFTIKHQKNGTAPTDYNSLQDLKWTDDLIKANEEAIKAGKFAVKTEGKEIYTATTAVGDLKAGDTIYLRSNAQGEFEIKGLEYSSYTPQEWNGTKLVDLTEVKNYYALKEVKAPKEYALIADPQTFVINKNSYHKDPDATDLVAADPDKVNNMKVTIPQTGGIGSLIFIVAGAAIMIGAFVAYKKSQAVEA